MRRPLKGLEEPYRSRAVPLGSARCLSWLFAAAPLREPLLGVYALQAEWRALMDPATDASVARVKLTWWQRELQQIADGTPSHPIGHFLASLPAAGTVDFATLEATLDAALAFVAGAPLEHARDLEQFATALGGTPLELATRLSGNAEVAALRPCTTALAAGEYLARAAHEYRRDARHGRVCFAVEELLEAGIEGSDLVADQPSPRLEAYLGTVSMRAATCFESAAALLPAAHRARERHLVVLAALQRRQLGVPPAGGGAMLPLKDLYTAWTTARRATVGR